MAGWACPSVLEGFLAFLDADGRGDDRQFSQEAVGNLQDTEPILPGYQRPRGPMRAVEKVAELGPEGLLATNQHPFYLSTKRVHSDLLAVIVEMHHPVRGSHLDLGDFVRRDPTRKEPGDAAATQPDLRYSQVLVRVIHVDADATDIRDAASCKRHYDINVVDHEVHDHSDVHDPGPIVWSDPTRLNEDRFVHKLEQPTHCGLEPLHMPHQEDEALVFGQGSKLSGLGDGDGHRFLDQDVDARREEIPSDFKMQHRWNDHAHGVDASSELPVVSQRFSAVPVGEAPHVGSAAVNNGDQFGVGEPGVDASMVPPPLPHPHHTYPQPLAHRSPRLSAAGAERRDHVDDMVHVLIAEGGMHW